MTPLIAAWLIVGFLILTWLAVWATRTPRTFVDHDPHWDCADEADRMYPEDTP